MIEFFVVTIGIAAVVAAIALAILYFADKYANKKP